MGGHDAGVIAHPFVHSRASRIRELIHVRESATVRYGPQPARVALQPSAWEMQDDGVVIVIRRYHVAEDNVQGANPEPEQHSGGMLKDPQSRRRFLRAAAIGTAGVAGVAGLAGVAQATGAPKILKHAFGLTGPISGSSSLEGFFEGTAPGTCTSTYSSTSADGGTNRFVTFYISGLPAGNGYSFSVTQDIGGGPQAIQPSGTNDATRPWEFIHNNSSAVHVVMDAQTDHSCPAGPSDDLNGSNSTGHSNFAFTFNVPSGTHNVAIYTHVSIGNGVTIPNSTTFTGTLSGPVNLGPVSITVNKA